MSENKIKSNIDALQALSEGVAILADTVGKTMGPNGLNVVIKKKHYNTVTKDGVSVAMQVFLADPYQNAGAQMVKEVALKTNQVAGDGTTTATVLANAIISGGVEAIIGGASPIGIKCGIMFAVDRVLGHLKENSQKIDGDYNKVEQIATISANNDPAIGKLIADAMEKIGDDGVIYIEESRLPTNQVEVITGVQINQGFIHPGFITDAAKGVCVLDNPVILLYDGKINTISQVLSLLDEIVKADRSLLIIADSVEGETLSSLVANKANGQIKACCVRSPFSDTSKEIMKDIAISTGGIFISEDDGIRIDHITMDDLGTCDRVIIGKETTTIVGGKGKEEDVKMHIAILKQSMSTAGSEYEQEQYMDRIAKLSQGVAILYVGGHTESEIKEKRDRIEDAINATRAAIQEGIIPGGGVALIRAADTLIDYEEAELSPSEVIGLSIVRTALYAPLRQICSNSGIQPDEIAATVRASKEYSYGFNAQKNQFGDLIADGVIDPAKVARVALENAASISILILTTSSIIID